MQPAAAIKDDDSENTAGSARYPSGSCGRALQSPARGRRDEGEPIEIPHLKSRSLICCPSSSPPGAPLWRDCLRTRLRAP